MYTPDDRPMTVDPRGLIHRRILVGNFARCDMDLQLWPCQAMGRVIRDRVAAEKAAAR